MILLDNLTLQGAARALDPNIGRPRSWEDRTRDGASKWDYEANDDVQTAVDVMCLSQLCQALVFHDVVLTSDDFVEHWKSDDGPLGMLSDIIRPTVVDDRRKMAFQNQAFRVAVTAAKTDEFNRYVNTLAQDDLMGTFLRISNGYFETGYSDPGIFEDIEFEDGYLLLPNRLDNMVNRLLDERLQLTDEARALLFRRAGPTQRIQNLLLTGKLVGAVWDRTRRSWWITPRIMESALTERRMRGYGSDRTREYPFDRLGLPDNVRAELAGGAKDLVRNFAATNYYGMIASEIQAQYLPHPLRAPFGIVAGSDRTNRSRNVSEEALVARMEFARAARATKINELISTDGKFGGALYVDLAFPFALALVMDAARSPDDFIRQLLLLRDSKPARRIRRWFTRFREELQEESLSIDEIESRARAFDQPISTWMAQAPGGDSATPSPITIGINLGFFAVEKGIRVRRPNLALREFRLIQDMARISNASPRLSSSLHRVFGAEVAEAWSQGQAVLRSAHTPGSPSILDRRAGY